jgi:hypothetical protein
MLMNVETLKAELVAAKELRQSIAEGIEHLEKAIAAFEQHGTLEASQREPSSSVIAMEPINTRTAPGSYVDDAVRLIMQAGHPLHARDLADGMSRLRNKTVSRASMESTLIRHMQDLKERARVARTAPSTFGIPNPSQVDSTPPRLGFAN